MVIENQSAPAIFSIGNSLISQYPKRRAIIHGVQQNLHHKNADQFFLRINPEFRSRSATPVVFTRRTHRPGFSRRLADREAEAEANTRRHLWNLAKIVAAH